MIWLLLFIGLLLIFGWVSSKECKTCGSYYLWEHSHDSNQEILDRYRKEIYDFDFSDTGTKYRPERLIYDSDGVPIKPRGIPHAPGCGCRLCYKNPKDFRDLKQYNWWDFHDTAGQQVYAGGTLPTFGLWRNKNDLRAPHCLKAKFDWRFNSPCTNPYSDKVPDYPFPADCKDGRCRIRGVFEDSIKYL